MSTRRYLVLIIATLLLLNLPACARDGAAGKYECPVQGFPSFYLDLNSDGTFWLQKPSREQTTGTWERKGNEIYLSSPDLNWMMFPAKLKIEGDMVIAVRPENPIPFERVGDVPSEGGGVLWPLFWAAFSIGIVALGFFIVKKFTKIPLPIPKPAVSPSTGKPQTVPPESPFKSERSAAESKPLPVDIKPSTPEAVSSRAETPIEAKPPVTPDSQPKPGDIGPGASQPTPPLVEMKPPASSEPQSSPIDVHPSGPVIIPAPIIIKDSEKPVSPAAKAKLVMTQTSGVEKEFPIFGDSVNIGRWDADGGALPEIDLTQDDPSTHVSRKHARIFFKDGKYFIEDLGSANGTFVNRGSRLASDVPQELKSGDEIVVGRTFLKFLA